jgi:hypothetical protein
MSAFFVRLLIILILFTLGAFVTSLSGNTALSIPVWFIAVTTWTLALGFRRALFVIIPFLIWADVLWDGTLGPLFLGGFLLATATTYLTVRIETRSYTLKTALYTLLITLFSLFVIWISFSEPPYLFPKSNFLMLGKIFCWQLLITILFIIPLSESINRVEEWLDNSYREQLKKIR